eukprot:CAMPEP_0194765828 /NCGR_PEP_ID=MMETSP0323_2-20130528/27271_1 /TAXON_ID=2866 ORGANISM="Crypthecodinium cohnii, Strain Seligo" /NCGR_SAMPLE_ID=MMETSP0323_2 /ASSEMBLY_ACC=CAM_ASM_000346 /LENGTH=96 /DNA_ID=CAMNT_0039696027 /DNA_START=105 /DNA_END=392 /DNA_ORIENTATION=-
MPGHALARRISLRRPGDTNKKKHEKKHENTPMRERDSMERVRRECAPCVQASHIHWVVHTMHVLQNKQHSHHIWGAVCISVIQFGRAGGVGRAGRQ